MSGSMQDRVIALAGLVQALAQVRRIADTGQADQAVLDAAIGSVFRIDAASPEEVYGDAASIRPGMRLLRDYFHNDGQDPLLPRLALAVMQLERRFVRDGDMTVRVRDRLVGLSAQAHNQGATHPSVLTELGRLYADTVSHLRPRVMVQGNPHYLAQAEVVAEIRAVLLAALRSAVLWRQMGGSLWDFLLAKRQMLDAVDGALA